MGRWPYSGRYTVEDCNKLSIFWLRKQGFLSGFKTGTITWTYRDDTKHSVGFSISTVDEDKYLRLYYTQTNKEGEKKDFDYKVPLTTTPCYFGGIRYWFICPWYANGIYCGRRVGVLYKGGDYFACRHCYNLTYASRLKSGIHKMTSNISFPELEALEKEVKRKYYRGKTTKKYKRFLKKEERLSRDLTLMGLLLGR